MSKIESGDLFVLGLFGNLYRLRPQVGGLSFVGQVALPNVVYPADLTSAKINGQAVLFVSYNSAKSNAVYSYSLDGKIDRTWFPRFSATGLVVDYITQTLYLAASDSSEIYSIDLKSNDVPKQRASILDGRKLGPLALHVARKMLYVADVATGNIYEVNLTSKKTRLLAPRLGLPQAMLVLEDQNILLIADSAGRKVYSLRLDEPSPRPSVFAAPPAFKSPSGLAHLAKDEIIVSDDSSGKLFIIGADGKLLYTYPPR